MKIEYFGQCTLKTPNKLCFMKAKILERPSVLNCILNLVTTSQFPGGWAERQICGFVIPLL